jgi:hypothetical protein
MTRRSKRWLGVHLEPALKTERAARAAVQKRLDRLLDSLQALRENGLLL